MVEIVESQSRLIGGEIWECLHIEKIECDKCNIECIEHRCSHIAFIVNGNDGEVYEGEDGKDEPEEEIVPSTRCGLRVFSIVDFLYFWRR